MRPDGGAMSRRLPDVVFLRPAEPNKLRSRCSVCNEELALDLPMSISEASACTRAFIRLHRRCAIKLADAHEAAR